MTATSSVLAGIRSGVRMFALAALAALVLVAWAAPALAGQAASGELLYYPCTNCHPVTMVTGADGKQHPSRPLPNNFQGHGIVLEGHDKLGSDQNSRCLSCHDDPGRNPGMLKSVDGTLIDIKTGDIATVCERCHEDKYRQFKAGTHGKHKPSCVAAGCHDPHTPQYIYAAPLLPFQGTGFQFKVLPVREPFKPLAPPAPAPATVIAGWFGPMMFVGFAVALGLATTLATGRFK